MLIFLVLLAVGVLFYVVYLRSQAKARAEEELRKAQQGQAREVQADRSARSTRPRRVLPAASPECGAKVDPKAAKYFYCGYDFSNLPSQSDGRDES
jgi:type II secretory pathway pseudopilin PulG